MGSSTRAGGGSATAGGPAGAAAGTGGGDPHPVGVRRLESLLAVVHRSLESDDPAALASGAARAVPRLARGAIAGAVAIAEPGGGAALVASGGLPTPARWDAGLADLPGYRLLARGRPSVPGPAAGGHQPDGWPPPALGVALPGAGWLRGILYAFGRERRALDRTDRRLLELLASYLAVALRRADLHAEATAADRRLARMMSITAGIAQRLDFSTIAQHIVDGLTAVTDFRRAAITLRDGDECQRLAASGLDEPRIGLTTRSADWEGLLREPWRRGEITYLIPPEAVQGWADVPERRPAEEPGAWTADHGLVVVLRSPGGELLGFLSVDEPRSRRLPDDRTVESLELFARQVEVALTNARLYSALQRVAERDSLTGLHNRRACWTALERALEAATADAPVTIAVVDIDDFKQVNDRHGHVIGDQALCHVADRLNRNVRETDRVYRVGGEEFVVVLPGATSREGVRVLRRAADAVKRVRGDLPALTLSVGVAEAPRHGTTADALFETADAALYAAKRRGKDRVVTADARVAAGAPTAGARTAPGAPARSADARPAEPSGR